MDLFLFFSSFLSFWLLQFFQVATIVMAQSGVDPLSGGAGWVGAGLLGAVLGWLLLKHLPDQQKHAEKITSEYTASLKDTNQRHSDAVSKVVEHCDRSANAEREASERRHQEQIQWLTKIHESARESVHATKNLDAGLRLRMRLADAVQSAEKAIWTKSLDGTIMSWNHACERLLGWQQGEIVGRSVFRIIPRGQEDQEREVLRRISNGEVLEEFQTQRVHRDGRAIDLVILASPIRDQAGRVVGVSTIANEPDGLGNYNNAMASMPKKNDQKST